MNWHLSIISTVIFILFSLANLFADKIPLDQSLSSLKDEVSQWKQGKISRGFQKKIRNRSRYVMSDGTCELELASKISTVTYYRLSCQETNEPSFIEFLSQNRNHLNQNEFRLKSVQRIGKKQYIEIQTGKLFSDSKEKIEIKQNTDDTDLDYPQKKEIQSGNQNRKSAIQTKPIQNPNLFYFQSIAENPKRRKEVPSNLEVFLIHLVLWNS